jgi:TubC N-terminal docking domain
MSSAVELIREAQRHGLHLRTDGSRLGITPADRCPPELEAELRRHKAEVIAALQQKTPAAVAEPEKTLEKTIVSLPPVKPKLYGWRELALMALQAAISDSEERDLIIAAAQGDAANWRFLKAGYVDHVFSNNVIDEIERRTGKIVCYLGGAECGPDGGPGFTGFCFREKQGT